MKSKRNLKIIINLPQILSQKLRTSSLFPLLYYSTDLIQEIDLFYCFYYCFH